MRGVREVRESDIARGWCSGLFRAKPFDAAGQQQQKDRQDRRPDANGKPGYSPPSRQRGRSQHRMLSHCFQRGAHFARPLIALPRFFCKAALNDGAQARRSRLG